MHSTDLDNGILFSTAIVGGGIPISLGAGFSIKYHKTDQVVVCFFGDGASNIGSFHESLNLASLWKLPIVFICENNQFGISVNVKKSTSVKNISVRATSYDIPGNTVNGNDVMAVFDATNEAVDRARKMQDPTLIECKTYRWLGHHMMDPGTEYRNEEEVESWKKKCPIMTFKKKLVDEGLLTESEFQEIDRQIQNELDEAVQFAKESSSPQPNLLLDFVYAPESINYSEPGESTRKVTFGEAIREALREEMMRDNNVFLIGEDIGRFGGVLSHERFN